MDKFSSACKEFGLTISISKTQVLSMEVPNMAVDGQRLEVVNHFTNLGSTVSSNLSLDKEIDHWIVKAAGTMGRLSKRVGQKLALWAGCPKESGKTGYWRWVQRLECVAGVVSTLLYSSETWTTYCHQENTFHIRCLMQIMGITWRDKIPNSKVPRWAKVPSMYALLR